MRALTWIVIASIIAILLGLGLWSSTGREEAVGSAARTHGNETPVSLIRPTSTGTMTERAAARAVDHQEQAEERTTPTPTQLVRGRVLDVHGEPVLGVELAWEYSPDVVFATSQGDGRFEGEYRRGGGKCVVKGDWVCLRPIGLHPAHPEDRNLVVVARAMDIGGCVIDQDGNPLVRALIWVDGTQHLTAFPLPLERGALRWWSATSKSEGRFRLPRSPVIPGGAIKASLEGYETAEVPFPATSRDDLELTLTRSSSKWTIRGTVVDEGGRPIAGATVALGRAVETDPRGRFELSVGETNDETLVVAKPRYRPEVVDGFGARLRAGEQALSGIEIVLSSEPLAIEGRVVLSDGSPAKGWSVELARPTRIPGFETAEGVPLGLERGTPTRSDGSFAIRGLAARSYVLHATESEGVLGIASEPIEAGTSGVELRLAGDSVLAEVFGRVQALDGSPVGDAQVSVTRRIGRVRGINERTDADGRFHLESVPRRHMKVLVRAAGFEDHWAELDVDRESKLVIQLARTRLLRIEPSAPDRLAGYARALDRHGDAVRFAERRANSAGGSGVLRRLVRGASPVLTVPETAETLEIIFGEDDRQRIELDLLEGEVTVIRY